MTDLQPAREYFRDQGRALLANGYLILPIKPGAKSPALASWQSAKLTATDLASYPGHGIGVICGQGAQPIVAVDIDISHPTIGPALVDWCRRYLPGAPERVGAAPRILLVYRALEAGWTKVNSTAFFDPADPLKPSGKRNEQRVEVLGLGQQFVAYHVHPDTHQPYEWIDWLGGLTEVRASDLPVITEAMLADLMAEVDRLVRMANGALEIISVGESLRTVGVQPIDFMAGVVPPTGTPLAETVALLGFYRNSDLDYDSWLHVGMALYHEYRSEEAFKVWVDWSAQSPKHALGDMRYKWSTFDTEGTTKTPTTLRWLLKVAGQAKKDAEVETVRESIVAIKLKIAASTDTVRMTGALAKEIKALLPDEPGARAEVFKAFSDKFKSISGASLTIADVRKLLAPPAEKNPTVKSKRPLTEFGNAERMLDRYGSGLMYVPELDQWYRWTGIFWHKCGSVEVEHYAKETIKALINEAEAHEGSPEFFEFCATSQQARMVKNMIALASSDPRVMVPVVELDKLSWALGVRNGVVDLRSGQLLPADPEYRITCVAGCDYEPWAKAPTFVATVTDAFSGNLEMMRFFHRLIGYSLLGSPDEDVLIIPWGNGSNGKSTVLNPIRHAFGLYGKTAAAETFVTAPGQAGGNAGGPREDIVRLKGARFVYVSEPDENSELRESAVKAMSGGDAIPARGINAKNSIEVEATWVAWMPTNHKPVIKGNDNGIWRRVVLLPFLRNYEEDPGIVKDENRQAKLMAELPGILAWCVQGAQRYAEAGLAMPGEVKVAREEYRSQMDMLADWLAECCEIAPAASESSTKLWLSWEQWAKRNGSLRHIQSSISLGKRLENRFPSVKGSGGTRMRNGLRLKLDLLPFSPV